MAMMIYMSEKHKRKYCTKINEHRHPVRRKIRCITADGKVTAAVEGGLSAFGLPFPLLYFTDEKPCPPQTQSE